VSQKKKSIVTQMRAQTSNTWLTCRPLAFCSFSGGDNYTTQKHLPKPLLSLEVVVVDKRKKKPTTTLSDFKVA
jgi:hypothetical protein